MTFEFPVRSMKLFNFPVNSASDKFELSNKDRLFEAMFRVLHRYQSEGLEPGAEHWQADTRWKRPQLIADIRGSWLSVVGCDSLLPWHDDYLIYCWVALRKCSKDQKRSLCEWFGLEIPRKWNPVDAEIANAGEVDE